MFLINGVHLNAAALYGKGLNTFCMDKSEIVSSDKD